MKRLFVYDPQNPKRDDVLAFVCSYAEQQGKKVHITVSEPVKSREQEEHYHALIRDIAAQVKGHGHMRSELWWKRILIDACKHETKNDPDLAPLWDQFGEYELAPAINNPGLVLIGEQSRHFGVKLASAFIEWLLAFGAEHDVKWSEPKQNRAQRAA